VVSGNKEPDKIAKAGLSTTPSELVNAPIINEFSIAVECRLISYDTRTDRCIGEIVNVSIAERVLDENGNVDMSKVKPIVFDPFNTAYLKLGDKVGNAFKDGFEL
jgi:flavin reductase (DIM6/NTAB) family NADH-FMN oxidoreductase RutF